MKFHLPLRRDNQQNSTFSSPRRANRDPATQPADNIVQRKIISGEKPTADIHDAAREGIGSGGSHLPHLKMLEAAFGPERDLSSVKAYVGGAATRATQKMGAEAYASGNNIAFRSTPSPWLVAHEAAHVVQQQNGIQLPGGVGHEGDWAEKNADEIADRVVQGRSARDLLGSQGASGSAAGAQQTPGASSVQRMIEEMDGNALQGQAWWQAFANVFQGLTARNLIRMADDPTKRYTLGRALFELHIDLEGHNLDKTTMEQIKANHNLKLPNPEILQDNSSDNLSLLQNNDNQPIKIKESKPSSFNFGMSSTSSMNESMPSINIGPSQKPKGQIGFRKQPIIKKQNESNNIQNSGISISMSESMPNNGFTQPQKLKGQIKFKNQSFFNDNMNESMPNTSISQSQKSKGQIRFKGMDNSNAQDNSDKTLDSNINKKNLKIGINTDQSDQLKKSVIKIDDSLAKKQTADENQVKIVDNENMDEYGFKFYQQGKFDARSNMVGRKTFGGDFVKAKVDAPKQMDAIENPDMLRENISDYQDDDIGILKKQANFDKNEVKVINEDEERAKYQIEVKDKLFVWSSNQSPVTVTNGIFVDFQGGLYLYDEEGSVNLGYKHSSLSKGSSVAMAGTMKIVQGVVTEITSASGHYKPNPMQLQRYVQKLQKLGIPVEEIPIWVVKAKLD